MVTGDTARNSLINIANVLAAPGDILYHRIKAGWPSFKTDDMHSEYTDIHTMIKKLIFNYKILKDSSRHYLHNLSYELFLFHGVQNIPHEKNTWMKVHTIYLYIVFLVLWIPSNLHFHKYFPLFRSHPFWFFFIFIHDSFNLQK